MEQVVQSLGRMLLSAAPTFILVLFLYIFLKKVFFAGNETSYFLRIQWTIVDNF